MVLPGFSELLHNHMYQNPWPTMVASPESGEAAPPRPVNNVTGATPRWGDAHVGFRDNAFAVVQRRWPIGSIGSVLNLALTYLILVVSLRAVGIEDSALGLAVILASFAVAFFAGVVIPITGSGLGVVDVVMVSALSASATGDVDVNVIVAAVVLWRLFYGLLAIIPGTFTLMRFSRSHRDLLRSATQDFSGGSDADSVTSTTSAADPKGH